MPEGTNPVPGGVYGGQDKTLTSFQIEMFLGFFLTAKLYDLNQALRNGPLLAPLQTHEGLRRRDTCRVNQRGLP